MNLEWIESYLAVVRAKSFRLAAREMGVAQPTVTQRIQKLERALGTPLVVRSRSGCALTAAGEAFRPYAESLLGLRRRAMDALRTSEIVVGASSNIGTYLLPAPLSRFREAEPQTKCSLFIDRNPVVAATLENGGLDLALTEWWDGRSGFVAQTWRTEELLLVVPPSHAWAGRSGVHVRELEGLELLGGEPGTGTARVLEEALGDTARRVQVAMRLGSTEAVKRAIRSGFGVSLLLAGTLEEERRAGVLVGLPVEGARLHKQLQCVHRRGLPEGHPVIRLAEFLASSAP